MATNSRLYCLLWIISSFLKFTIISLLCTILLRAKIFYHALISFLFLLVLLFGYSMVFFSFFTFFSNSSLASLDGHIALFVTIFPKSMFISTNTYESSFEKLVVSLFPCNIMALGLKSLVSICAKQYW